MDVGSGGGGGVDGNKQRGEAMRFIVGLPVLYSME
jgi:hypothetical protein